MRTKRKRNETSVSTYTEEGSSCHSGASSSSAIGSGRTKKSSKVGNVEHLRVDELMMRLCRKARRNKQKGPDCTLNDEQSLVSMSPFEAPPVACGFRSTLPASFTETFSVPCGESSSSCSSSMTSCSSLQPDSPRRLRGERRIVFNPEVTVADTHSSTKSHLCCLPLCLHDKNTRSQVSTLTHEQKQELYKTRQDLRPAWYSTVVVNLSW